MTDDDDLANAETLRRFKEEGGGSLPRFTTHDQLRDHLVKMSDTELNRMRDFGCGKPHWSPYYVEAAYTHESRAIEGDRTSMAMTVPLEGEKGFQNTQRVENTSRVMSERRGESRESRESKPPSSTPSSRGSSKPGSQAGSARPPVPSINLPTPLSSTSFSKASSRKSTARSLASSPGEARRIEDLLKAKEREVVELRAQLAKTRESNRG